MSTAIAKKNEKPYICVACKVHSDGIDKASHIYQFATHGVVRCTNAPEELRYPTPAIREKWESMCNLYRRKRKRI